MGFGLISSLLPKPQVIQGEEELDSDTEEILRETTLLVLRLFYVRAITQLYAMEQELELLRNAPPSPMLGPESGDSRDKRRNVDEDDWKLDIPLAGGPDGKGPLMDAQGKVSPFTSEPIEHLLTYYFQPLRSFTILPSDAGERARLQAQVFAPGHRLPTMSIDEYLEIERQRGNIITSGGRVILSDVSFFTNWLIVDLPHRLHRHHLSSSQLTRKWTELWKETSKRR